MKKTLLIISVLSFIQISCERDFSSHYPYHPPENIDDGLEVGTLDEVNIEAKMIAKAVGRIHQGKYNEVHAMLIFKDDKLVFEEYFKGHKFNYLEAGFHGEFVTWDKTTSHTLMSVTKSITSACIGIAIDQGFIKGVHQSIFDFLPDYQQYKKDGKEKITIEHLLTMTSGLKWDEWRSHGNADNDIDRLWIECEDPVKCVLEKSLEHEPGKNFTYNGGGMIILGEIIKNATGMNMDEFSSQYLFKPLGIDSTHWDQFENEMYDAAGGLHVTPRSMVKFGATYLNDGIWRENQLVPKTWVEKSAKPFSGNKNINIPGDDTGRNGYSYSWWTNTFSYTGNQVKMYNAGGWGGQSIMVIPGLDMVIVFTGGNYTAKTSLFEIVERFILPSIK